MGLVCGDQNFDQVVDVSDAIIDLQMLVGLVQPTDLQTLLSDVEGDGDLNVLGVVFLLQHLVGEVKIDGCGRSTPRPSPNGASTTRRSSVSLVEPPPSWSRRSTLAGISAVPGPQNRFSLRNPRRTL